MMVNSVNLNFREWTNMVYVSLTGLDKRKISNNIVNIYLPIDFNICFGCSKEPSH